MLKSVSILFMIGLMASMATAQSHVVEVRDGRIYVDGRAIEASVSAPASSIDARLVVPRQAAVMIELDGRILRISSDGAEEIDGAFLAFPVENLTRDVAREGSPTEAEFIAAQAEELRRRAREMERIGVQLQSARVPDYELFQMIEVLRHSAMEADRVAQALPHFRVQGYLSDVREQNEELYERLVREQRLEEESLRLSREIHALGGAEREGRVAELRSRLEEIFRMKQENRQREIEELESRLHSMQERLAKRARHHDYIIERRLEQLIGSEERRAP